MALERKNGTISSGARFIKEPKAFDGNDEGKASVWLARINRLKKSDKISDEEMLIIVEENLVGKAESWWDVVGAKTEN
ncbi:hypothetical protein [Parasitella parasitica]|uniref:Uncharacterized protein n=1 Tax=Parasitella parasitica TaxID=35722 RepID=A0A0B7NQW6_9FUNG|nr:hypothetical protein [Parasitella parasitica]